MTDPKEELELALRYFRELDAQNIEEKRQAQAVRNIVQRRRGDKRMLEEILASTGIDLEKIREYEKTSAEESEKIRRDLINLLTPPPPGILSLAQDTIKVNQLGGMAPPPPNWLSWELPPLLHSAPQEEHTADGSASCGSQIQGGMMHPRTETTGHGSGLDDGDSPTAYARCGWWYALPSQNVPANTQTPIYVSPFFDLHGCYVVDSNDHWYDSQHAEVTLTVSMSIAQRSLGNSINTQLSQKDIYIEEKKYDTGGRIEHTRYGNTVQWTVFGGAQVQIEVYVEAFCNAQGHESYALMDFQSDQNYFYVPWVLVSIPAP